MPAGAAPKVALAPSGTRGWLADAIAAGGGSVVDLDDAEALVWTDANDAEGLAAALAAAPRVRWVQLPFAGVEPFVPVLDGERLWTCGKGVYAAPVAEHALALLLAGLRNLVAYGRASAWSPPAGINLIGARVVVLGGGGITESLLRLLQPFGADVQVVRRHPEPMDGASDVVGVDDLDRVLGGADGVVLALALTPETDGVIDRRRLDLLPSHTWVVNVARGRHIVTDDLVAALAAGTIGGAALDVTEPEPLPPDHPLWSLPNCIITPHVGNTPDMAVPLLSARITENVRRFAAGEPLLGPIDVTLGY